MTQFLITYEIIDDFKSTVDIWRPGSSEWYLSSTTEMSEI